MNCQISLLFYGCGSAKAMEMNLIWTSGPEGLFCILIDSHQIVVVVVNKIWKDFFECIRLG